MFNLWKQFQDTRSIQRNPSQDCPRATTSREDLHLSIIERRNRDAAVSQLSRRLHADTVISASRVTVSRIMKSSGEDCSQENVVCVPSVLLTGDSF
ncbi:HTH_Tnp_Tc3_2 domain-containing protein [Trichonephila clavipes]|nr:HTH_Tnp_Tc3_2 domain-containing protein [Trichonephila clavipes]